MPVEGLEQAIESRITPWRVDVSTFGKEQKDVEALGHRSIEEPSQFLCCARLNDCCKIPCSSEFAHCLLHPIYPQILYSTFVDYGCHTLLPCTIPLCAQCHLCVPPEWLNLALKLLLCPARNQFTKECSTGQIRNASFLLCVKKSSYSSSFHSSTRQFFWHIYPVGPYLCPL